MMTFLEFAFQSFWHFAGVLVLIWSVPASVGATIKAIRGDWFDNYLHRTMENLPPVGLGNYTPDKSVRPDGPPPAAR